MKRQAVYSNIRTLELEHELGKLDEEDYRLRLQSYRLAAAATFKDQEQLEELDCSIEEDVAAVRESRRLEG